MQIPYVIGRAMRMLMLLCQPACCACISKPHFARPNSLQAALQSRSFHYTAAPAHHHLSDDSPPPGAGLNFRQSATLRVCSDRLAAPAAAHPSLA